MANKRIGDLPVVTAPDPTDLFAIDGPTTRALSAANLQAYVLSGAGASFFLTPVYPAGRLTLTTGVPVTGSDVTGAATLYYSAIAGQYVSVWDGAGWRGVDISTDLSLALDSNSGHTGYQQSGKNFDVWVAYVSGVTYFGTGPTWNAGAGAGSDTARGTGAASSELQIKNGVLTNKNSMTLRFGSSVGNTVTVPVNQATLLGTIRTTADGVTEDSFLKRFVSNLYNSDFREMRAIDTTDNWNWSTASFHQKNASAANQVEWVHCVAGRSVVLDEDGFVTNLGASTHDMGVGIGIDSTTTASNQRAFKVTGNNTSLGPQRTSAFYNGYPGIGYHKACELEYGGGSDTQLWFGDAGVGPAGSGTNGPVQTGMSGRTLN